MRRSARVKKEKKPKPAQGKHSSLKHKTGADVAGLEVYGLLDKSINAAAYHRIITDKKKRPVDYEYLYVNAAFEKFTGLKRENVIGNCVRKLIPGIEKDSAGWIKNFGAVALKGGEWRAEYRSEALKKWYSVMSYCPRHGYFIAIFEDVTDRKLAEERIKEQKNSLNTTLRSIGDAVIAADAHGRVTFMNPVAEKLTGYREKEAAGLRLEEVFRIINEQTGKKAESPVAKVLKKGVIVGLANHTVLISKTGKKIPIEDSGAPIKDDKGRITGVVLVFHDVTEKREAQRLVEESEQRYRLLYKGVNDAMFVTELFGRRPGGFLEVNDEACRSLGYTRKELLNMTIPDIAPPESVRIAPKMIRAIITGKTVAAEVEHIKKDGTIFPVELKLSSASYGGRAVMIGLARDITKFKATERRLELEKIYSETREEIWMDVLTPRVKMENLVKKVLERVAAAIGAGMACFLESGENGLEAVVKWKAKGYKPDKDIEECSLERIIEGGGRETAAGKMPLVVPCSYADKEKGVFVYLPGGKRTEWQRQESMLANEAARILSRVFARRAAEELVAESEERYRELVNNANDAVFVNLLDKGRAGRLIEVNPAACRITHRKKEELLNLTPAGIVSEESLADFSRIGSELARKGKAVYETTIKTPSGQLIEAEINSHVFMYRGERAVLSIMRDITERKRFEKQLEESEEKFRMLSEQSLLGIGILQDGLFKYFNDAFLKMLGYTRGEVVSMRPWQFAEIVHPEDREMVIEQTKKRLSQESDAMTNYSFRIITKGVQVKWLEIYSKNIIYNGKTAEMFTQADITDMMNIREELERAVISLKKSNEELERFAYVASHDLQEPLRMVSSYVQLLERRYKDKLDADAAEFISYAVEGAGRMQRLIKDLLAYSRLGTKEKKSEQVDTQKLVDAALNNLLAALSEKKAVIKKGRLPVVKGDEGQLLQLFQNLIGNAIKFAKKDEACIIEIRAEAKEGEVVFSVKDNGIGIPPEYREKIFVVFQRLHAGFEYGGTGIGLAICKRVVENHGGSIRVESETGRGAEFIFTLPEK
ncbi:MAG TPA: PAS domain S-box protein [bacterium]|nr:PAS domain S-box protein [bacterium]